jgi:hypothetical protein
MSIDTPNPSDMRIVYDKDQLTEADLATNPLDQFTKWLADAVAEGREALIEPNAMVIAVRSAEDIISTRSVLLKGIDSRGLTFYTNYGSTKADAISTNSQVSVTFPWYPLHRQVNVVGTATKVSREELIQLLVKDSEGLSQLYKTEREGVIWRLVENPHVSFKVISPKFLDFVYFAKLTNCIEKFISGACFLGFKE